MKLVVAIIAVVLLAAGPAALVAPESAATAFGIALDGPASRVYLLATATRDAALGSLLLGLLGLGVRRRVLATSLWSIAIVAAGDASNVIVHATSERSLALVTHLGGLAALLGLGWWLWRSDDT